MQKRILSYYFYISVAVGSFIYLAQQFEITLPKIVNNYVNDFLILPIVLTICLFILRWSRGDKSYTIPLGVIIYICAFYGVIFEYLLPKFHPRYTADFIDVFLYFISGVVFYFLQKKDGSFEKLN